MQNRIEALRELLRKNNIDGYLIPSTDEFNNEYLPAHFKRLEWITGFTGSNGLAIIAKDILGFFTDGRYLTQATLELDREFQIFDISSSTAGFYFKLKDYTIGFDPNLFTEDSFKSYNILAQKYGFTLKVVEENLIDQIWTDKSIPQKSEIIKLGIEFTGKDTKTKVKELLAKFPSHADYIFLSAPASICWLLNIRADDIKYTPFLLSYLIIDRKGNIELFVHNHNLDFKLDSVAVKSSEGIKPRYLEIIKQGYNVALDTSVSAYWFIANTPSSQLIRTEDPCLLPKACKNTAEIKGMQEAHIEDAVAICKFFYWLEQNIDKNIDEIEASDKLLSFRKEGKHFRYPSFATISAFAENGAIIHYHPNKITAKVIQKDNLYLIDSGGQYLTGTTDVTRVLCFGKASTEQIKNFTLVLKGFIALSNVVFPIHITGLQLDSLARYHLWQHGLDYPHGTGHGVGHFLSVHEGPHRIAKGKACHIPLLEGMVTSIEPGVYKENQYGIRIENLAVVQKSEHPNFLELAPLTLVPIEHNLIDKSLLSSEELKWLNNYHDKILKLIAPRLNEDESKWLEHRTKPL